MYNLIVAENGDAWERRPFVSPYVRFGEYSDERIAASLDLDDPPSVASLAEVPTFLMLRGGCLGTPRRRRSTRSRQ